MKINVQLDSVSFQLKEQHDFDWLRDLGEVFTVFDEQDSGNICFGVEKDDRFNWNEIPPAMILQFLKTQ